MGLDKVQLSSLIGVIKKHYLIGKIRPKWDAKIADFFRICNEVKELELDDVLSHSLSIRMKERELKWLRKQS